MLYYLEMPKIGGVFHDCNERAFTDYSVNPRWITGWLQGRKMKREDAQKVIVFFFIRVVVFRARSLLQRGGRTKITSRAYNPSAAFL